MFNRVSGVALAAGLAAGYLFAAPAVKAQNQPGNFMPFAVGENVTLQFERGTYSENTSTVTCAVAEIQGLWVRCGSTDPFRPEQQWYSLQRIYRVVKRDK